MKVTIAVVELKRALFRMRRGSRQSPISLYARVAVRDGKAMVHWVNQHRGVSLSMPVQIKECSGDGVVVVPIKKLLGILRGFLKSGGKKDLVGLEQNGTSLHIEHFQVFELKPPSKRVVAQWERLEKADSPQ